jgi:uncharacterized NAD(P)/FAD-binding protein YdhS
VAIIGAGVSGTALAAYLLSEREASSLELHLIGLGGPPSPGDALGETDPSVILNLPAGRMSLWPDSPNDFLRWARSRGPAQGWKQAAAANGATYLPRRLFELYVQDTLEDAIGRAETRKRPALIRHAASVRRLAPAEGGFDIRLDDETAIRADAVVLAMGFQATALPFPIAGSGERYIANPRLPNILESIGRHDTVVVAGTNLTMVEVLYRLERRRFAGSVTAISPHGMLPLVRGVSVEHPPVLTEADMHKGVRHALRALRDIVGEGRVDWRTAVDSLIPTLESLWQALPAAEQDRFQRHLRPIWRMHRNRMPAESADLLLRHTASGRLRVEAARILRATLASDRVEIELNPRGTRRLERRTVGWFVNCRPPAPFLSGHDDGLTGLLLTDGLVRLDRTGRGYEVDQAGQVIAAAGTPITDLFALGPLRGGYAIESNALPDFRPQLQDLTNRLLEKAERRPRRRHA